MQTSCYARVQQDNFYIFLSIKIEFWSLINYGKKVTFVEIVKISNSYRDPFLVNAIVRAAFGYVYTSIIN